MFCPGLPHPTFFLFSSSAPSILYYSHLPIAGISLIIAVWIYIKNKELLAAKALLWLSIAFAVWAICDISTYIEPDPSIMMFTWAVTYVAEIVIYAAFLYFAYTFLERRQPSFVTAFIGFLLVAPAFLLMSTPFVLEEFLIVDGLFCEAIESGTANNAFFGVEIVFSLWLVGYLVRSYAKGDREKRMRIALLSIGATIFLVSFLIANMIGSYTLQWELSQYGLFGMAVFIAILAYLIVHYEAFNVKLIGAQALVWALWILVSALLFLKDVPTIKVISVITLILLIGFGIALIRSVKREVEQRKQLELLTKKLTEVNEYLTDKVNEQTVEVRKAYDVEKKAKEDLEKLDKAKTQFILTTQHHLRTPLTVVSGTVKMLAEKAVGTIFAPADDLFFAKARAQSDKMATLIDEFVSIANLGAQDLLKKERLTILPSIQEVLEEAAEEATKKKLRIETSFAEDLKYVRVLLHPASFRNALANVIDNSIKYTPENGSLSIKGTVTRSTVKLTITDSGIGMTKEEQEKAFTSAFERGEEAKALYATGRGIGLIVSRNIIESHNGTIRAESLGRDHGTTVVIELPMVA